MIGSSLCLSIIFMIWSTSFISSIITLRFKENFSLRDNLLCKLRLGEKFSYLSSVSTRRGWSQTSFAARPCILGDMLTACKPNRYPPPIEVGDIFFSSLYFLRRKHSRENLPIQTAHTSPRLRKCMNFILDTNDIQ